MSNDFAFCPSCGGKNIQNINNRKWICADCGFDLYNNTAAAVGCIICNENDEVLFEVREKEPRKGFLALPGGFIDPDESAEDAAVRECKEELDAKIKSAEYLCSFPNTYIYRGITYKTCDLFFTAALSEGTVFHTQEKEVQSIIWKKITSKADLDSLPLAFESARFALEKWLLKKGGQK